MIKEYKDGEVITRFPGMSGIIASPGQRNCPSLFKEAVAFARAINNDPEKKKAYLKKTAKNQTVFNAAISNYIEKNEAS